MLAVAVLMVPVQFREGLFVVAGAALHLLFTGIPNAWDPVAYHVLVGRGRDRAGSRLWFDYALAVLYSDIWGRHVAALERP